MTRRDLHEKFDEVLDKLGYGDKINPFYGSITMQVNFEADKAVILIRERETVKTVKA